MIKLPNLKNKKTVFLAVGNILRGDDAFGPLVYEALKNYARPNFLPLDGGEMPENFTSKITSFSPDYLVVADAAFLPNPQPYALQIIEGSAIADIPSTTHNLPLSVLFKFIKADAPNLQILFIALNAQDTDFGAEPGLQTQTAAKEAASAILKAL